jgi:hypothetical protein
MKEGRKEGRKERRKERRGEEGRKGEREVPDFFFLYQKIRNDGHLLVL